MSEQLKVILKGLAGVVLIMLGILGLILPVFPGLWLIPMGVQLLGWRLVIEHKKPWREMIKLISKKK